MPTFEEVHLQILKHGAHGESRRYVWRWYLKRGDTQTVTRVVNSLLKLGLIKASYYDGCEASVTPTDAGREYLKRTGN